MSWIGLKWMEIYRRQLNTLVLWWNKGSYFHISLFIAISFIFLAGRFALSRRLAESYGPCASAGSTEIHCSVFSHVSLRFPPHNVKEMSGRFQSILSESWYSQFRSISCMVFLGCYKLSIETLIWKERRKLRKLSISFSFVLQRKTHFSDEHMISKHHSVMFSCTLFTRKCTVKFYLLL
jgi:hypothetical protein